MASGLTINVGRSDMPNDPKAVPCYIGIDIGGTKTLGVLLGANDSVIAKAEVRTPLDGDRALQDTVIAMVQALVVNAQSQERRVAGVGIGAPGFVDSKTGLIVDASNLRVQNLAIGRTVEATCGLPTYVMHDVRAATLAESLLGMGRGLDHFAYLNVGTGVAAGFVFNGRLYGGAGDRAGEIGHVVLDPGGALCSCGKRGCLEALASGVAIAASVEAAVEARPRSILAHLRRDAWSEANDPGTSVVLSGSDGAGFLTLAANSGDPDATAIIRAAATYLGRAVAWMVDTLALQRVVLGGGVIGMGEVLLKPLRVVADETMLKANRTQGLIVLTALGSEVGGIGAALAARQQYASPEEAI